MTDRGWRVLGLPFEVAMLIVLVFTSLVVRRCQELDNEAREACAAHRCSEDLEPVLVEDKCVCMQRVP
jgi:hypothetical protein